MYFLAGSLLWLHQATRYLMRYPSPRLCSLLNGARHHAFGGHVADLVMAHGPTVEQEMASGSREEGGSETEQGMPVRGIPVQVRGAGTGTPTQHGMPLWNFPWMT